MLTIGAGMVKGTQNNMTDSRYEPKHDPSTYEAMKAGAKRIGAIKAKSKALRAKMAINGTGTHEKVTGGEHFRKI